MALFILCGNNSSLSARIYILALIALIFACSFSYCSSSSASSFGSPIVDIGEDDVDNFDIDKNFEGENNLRYHLLYRPLLIPHHYINADEHPMSSKNRFLNLLLKSVLTQSEDYPHRQYQIHVDNKRYAPQSFHAMRG